MSRSNTQLTILVISCVLAQLPVQAVERPGREEAEIPAAEAARLVTTALQFEQGGDNMYRDLTLRLALRKDPDHAAAHWHLGHVKIEDQWLPFEEAERLGSTDPVLSEYFRQLRAAAEPKAEFHARLAEWCQQQGLDRPAHLHALKALQLPRDARIVKSVGAVLAKTAHESSDDERLDEARLAMAKAWEHWIPKLAQLRADIETGREPKRRSAIEELRSIREPLAIPALEAVISPVGKQASLEVVAILKEMAHHEAALSLARHAVFATEIEVRKVATKALKERRKHDFVPWLLDQLVSPVKTQFWVERLPGGGLRYFHDYLRPGANQDFVHRQVVNLRPRFAALQHKSHTIHNIPLGTTRTRARWTGAGDPTEPNLSPELRNLMVAGEILDDEIKTTEFNRRAELLNGRIEAVLNETTEQNLHGDPVAWWTWWQRYNEYDVNGGRQPVTSYIVLNLSYSAHKQVSYEHRESTITTLTRRSCFPAGTPVWTRGGPVNIEQIREGDMVLAQDIETGELAYKLVLGTTTRPLAPLLRLTMGDEQILATLGHPFWVNDKGWEMAKLLQPGDLLHSAGGSVRLDAVEQTDPQVCYNLIVDQFANYFVGKNRLLVHDNRMREPTNRRVPGLAVVP